MHALALAILVLLSFSTVDSAITVSQFINDNHVLNYALTLENLEAAYYAAGLAKFGTTDANYTAAGFPQGTGPAINLIAQQEQGHANSLTSVLRARGWPAVTPCTYNFAPALGDVQTFVNTLAVVENLGTSAYLGAANALTSADLLTIAAGITTVEARHTALLNVITNNSFAAPFPLRSDIPQTPQSVLGTAGGFIVSCTPVTQAVNYGPNSQYTVSSSNSSSFANFVNSADARGNTTVANLPNLYANTPAGQQAQANDFAVLNYALTLEHLEAFFYQNFTAAYTPAQITGGNVNANTANIISQSINLIREHEAFHVSYLQTLLGSSATQPCNYSFVPLGLPYGSNNFTAFISAAGMLENTGVAAYVGAIRLIINPFVAGQAASIATVEARHAAYIADVRLAAANIYGASGNVAFDASPIGTQNFNDLPQTPSQVAGFLTSNNVLFNCPPSNPADIYGIGRTNTQQDFFGDVNGNALSPFVGTASGNTNTAATNTITNNPTGTVTATVTQATPTSTLTQTRSTGAASALSLGFAVLAVAAALF